MKFRIYVQDLRDDWIARIRQVLRHELAEEIEEAIASGMDRETAEAEVVDDYLNRHNVGWDLEI